MKARRSKQAPPLDSPNWLPIHDAIGLGSQATGNRRLAARDLHKAMADPRGVPAMRRCTVHGGPDREQVPYSFWAEHDLDAWSDRTFVRGPDDQRYFVFYVWQPALAKVWPTVFGSAPPSGEPRRKEPRRWGLIRDIAAEFWPGGYGHVETREIIKRVGDEFERRGLSVPKRDVFLRALDRR